MRAYTAEKYIRLVEDMDDDVQQNYIREELEFISKIQDSKNKTFIDIGAGYGRVLPRLSEIARNVISIEINSAMLSELNKRTKKYNNAKLIEGDVQKLSELLEDKDVKNPVLLILENTLGTIEGDYEKVLLEMKKVAQKYNGEVVISIYRKESLGEWGIKELYFKEREMTGEPDLQKTDLEKGVFVSKTGYVSKWWSLEEITKIRDFFKGKVINEVVTPQFYIFHVKV